MDGSEGGLGNPLGESQTISFDCSSHRPFAERPVGQLI